MNLNFFGCFFVFIFLNLSGFSQPMENAWKMHVIDNDGYGADGVKLWQNNEYNVFTVSWEQSGESRCYVFDKQMTFKHAVSVPSEGVEDAIIFDLNSDEIPEIISFLENPGACIKISYATGNWLEDKNTKFNQVPIESSENQLWMFGEVCDLNEDGLPDIVAGSKNAGASVSIFFQNVDGSWKQNKLTDAGWIMTLELHDFDFDGDPDIFFTDRKGETSGVKWIENSGSETQNWPIHEMGLKAKEPMFSHVEIKPDFTAVYASEISEGITFFTMKKGGSISAEKLFELPEIGGTRLKDICIGDIDNDGKDEIISSFEGAENKHGLIYSKKINNIWKHFPVSHKHGIKFDLSLLFDMDNDGDLDILNTEENNNSNTTAGLGFVWYENPAKKRGDF